MLNSAIIHWVFRYASDVVPTVAISNVSSISYTGATVAGNVTAAGSSAVTERGICYGTSYDPTITGTKAISGSGTGSFSANLTGLTAGTTYYVRAYATNTAGTGYSTNATFSTTAITAPSVTTVSVGTITSNSVIVTGNATAENGSSIIGKGICWNSTGNPTIANSIASAGPGTGSFSITIGGLSANTTYYARAYATNAAGTGYGTTLSFTTAAAVTVPTVTTGTASSVTSNSADVSGNVTATGGATVTERGICYGTSANPTVSGTHVASGSGTGSFTASLTGLTASTTYYVRAYATNSAGTAYGSQSSFATSSAPAGNIPFEAGMQYLNTTYPNRQKTLCWNFSVNDDNLAYVFVEPDNRAAGSESSWSKQLVIIHAENGVIADHRVTIPSSVPSGKNYMNVPYANNGFVGYFPASGRATNYAVVMKVNTTTGELEHVGSSSAYVQVISLGSRKWPGGSGGGFTVDGKFYINYGIQQDNSERPMAICLNNSGSSSTYWSSSLIGTSGVGTNSYRTIATALVGDASSGGTNVVMFARYARNTNWSYNDYVLYKTNVSTIYNGAGTQLLTSTPNFNSFNPVATTQPVFIPAYGEQNMRGWIAVMTASGYHLLSLKINSQDIALTDLLTASAGSVSYTSSYHTLHRDRIYQSCGLFYLPVKVGNDWKIWSLDSSLNTTLSDFL